MTTLNNPNETNNKMLPADQIQLLTQQIQSFDNRLESYNKTTTTKLDMLLDLTRQMAMLSERQQHQHETILRIETKQSNDIHRLDERITRTESDKDTSIERVHKRLDEIQIGIQDKITVLFDKLDKRISDSIESTNRLDDDYKADKNYVRGAMGTSKLVQWAFGIIFALSQVIVFRYTNDLQNANNVRDAKIVEVEKTVQQIQLQGIGDRQILQALSTKANKTSN